MASEYVAAETLDQVFGNLGSEEARLVAGGTDLMVHLRKLKLAGSGLPKVLVDITGIPELNRYEPAARKPYLGAAVTFHRLETDSALAEALPVLAQAAATVGSAQVRCLATLGGNVANASPAADGLTALVALGAKAEIASPSGRRRVNLEELVTGPNQTTLGQEELILGFELEPPAAGAGQVFVKVGRRRAVVIARMNVAVCLDRELRDPRVVLGACFPSPRRLREVEEMIARGSPGAALWQAAGLKAADQFLQVCGWRSSAPYKVPAVARVVARTLEMSWRKVGG
ncbi:MAG: FAD binding domain-containing protein [Thermodesulfobacteriota bacterium]